MHFYWSRSFFTGFSRLQTNKAKSLRGFKQWVWVIKASNPLSMLVPLIIIAVFQKMLFISEPLNTVAAQVSEFG